MKKSVYFPDFTVPWISLVVLIYFNLSSAHYYVEHERCGVLYSGERLSGDQYVFNDRDQSINLEEDGHASENGWNTTGSLKIEDTCSMDICNEIYFDGSCAKLTAGTYSTTTDLNLSSIVSVSCTCAKECKCSDIFMKRSSCARAYLKGGCKTCHSLYVDLNGSRSMFAEEFADKVESLILRKGCTLTVYSDEHFMGDEEVIDSEIVEEYKGTIGSYECECNHDEYKPRVPLPRPDSYPPLIDIPNTLDEVIKMLSDKNYSEHPGLRGALKSLRHKRSGKNAYILLLGYTGSGKSSAINLLFDNPNVTKVGTGHSITTDIHEFRIPVNIDELGVANSELRVIDTPGLGDTRGLEQDAKFLATLDSFLTNHEELKDRIPNVVLVFHKFNDNRFYGEGSQFVRMLRGFDSFRERITDENYSNVIFVLSHFCSETNKNRRQPGARLGEFKKAIQDFSLFPKPILITVAENKAEDHDLPMVNGYFRLPNFEYYPRNLFEKMELVTENGGDTIGRGVFTTAFRDSNDFNVTSHTFKLVDKASQKVQFYRRLLTNALIPVHNTEVSQLLTQVWDNQVDAHLRIKFPLSLHYLHKSLNIRNVNTKEDIPKTSTAILELLTAITHDEATRVLLEKALNIKPPVFGQNTIAGFSYNVFKDAPLPTSPLKMTDLQPTDIGFTIPNILTCKLETGTKEQFHVFDNRVQYLQQRLKSLGIEGTISNETFTGTVKPGHNIKEISFKDDGCTISATREFRLFEFVLNDRLDLTEEFKSTVKSLPPFNETDHENVAKWTQFFNDYGTHVVRSVYGGGAIEIQLQSDKPFNNDLAQALFDLIKFAEEMSFLIDEGNGTESSNRTVLKEGISHTLTFLGGDSAYHTTDLTKMSVEQASKLLMNWKKSLKFSPAVLNTEMRLEPLSRVVRKLGQNYTSEIDRATSLLFKSELVYVPPKSRRSSENPILDRSSTPFLSELLKAQQESSQKIQEMMMEMRKIEMENERRRQEMEQKRMEWEQEKYREEQEYKKNLAEQNKLQEAERQQWAQKMEEARLDREAKRLEQQQRYQKELMEAHEAANRRNQELLKELIARPPPSSSCLKPGTTILMADFSEKNVESVKVGDMVLDKDFNSTRVIGASYEFLLQQKFYGFNNEPSFFTNSHKFVGPANADENNGSGMKIYAESISNLYTNNPLMKYLNVTEMGSYANTQVTLFHLENFTMSVYGKAVHVVEDPQIYAVDTPVYFIEVDSPTGTYFANGYVCQHEIPPVEYWPNTMSLLFRLMNTPAFEKLSQLKYSLPVLVFLEDITNEVATTVQQYIHTFTTDSSKGEAAVSSNYPLMTLGDVNITECISKIFNNPTVASGVGLYAKVGVILSQYLDSDDLGIYDVSALQHGLYDVVIKKLESLIM